MKQLTTFGGQTFALEDEEAENIKNFWAEDNSKPIELRSGSMVNPKAIESIGELETVAYFMGNKMNKGQTRVFVNGEWKEFAGSKSQIEHRPIVKLEGAFKRIQ